MKSSMRKSSYFAAMRQTGMTWTERWQGSEIAQRNKPVPFTVFTQLFWQLLWHPVRWRKNQACQYPLRSEVSWYFTQEEPVTELVVRHCHNRVEHQGRGITLSRLWASNYWIIGGNSVVGNYISKCVTCRKLGDTLADLPEDRVLRPPRKGRRGLKRYRVLFTWLASAAIDLETANALTTDPFINGVLNRCSSTGQIQSDRGTNVVCTM